MKPMNGTSAVSPAKQALLALKEMEGRLATAREPVAIVGMGCRYPGAAGLTGFWRLLVEGRDAIAEVPRERWNLDAVYDPDPAAPGKMSSRMAGLLPRLDEFDAQFFGITPREAPHVDPRQRVILESAWEALEDAGIPPDSLAGTSTGVFLATLTNDYDHLLFEKLCRAEAYSGAGTANSIVANRVSYFLDLHGPSLALDTACSGSLVAIHLACESLRRGESTLALAGGVNVNLMPKSNVFFSKAGALSPTGRCRTFDARADGMVRSDGAGVIVLKRLSDAQRDGDPIAAVIRASAVNHDGRSNGIMAPNGQAQRAVLEEAYRRAGIEPGEVQYVEAHGTATRLGDPIEARALGEVLARGRVPGRICAVGSVKTNIGHTEAAAGVAGVIKTALAMRHRLLPASLHFETPNPLIAFDGLPLRVQAQAGPWPSEDARLIAGVSAFGFGGTNAHVVLEEAPIEDLRPTADAPYLLPLSAKSPEALTAQVALWQERLAADGVDPGDLCYTAGARRSHHVWRIAVAGESKEALAAKLEVAGIRSEPAQSQPRTVFIFSGQGSHWAGMGRALYKNEPIFRAAMEQCDGHFQELAGWSLLEEIGRSEAESRIGDTALAQPAIFAVQVALAALWRSWGIAPDLVAGHSLGEAAAAYVAGSLSLADAARVVFHRSRLMKTLEGNGRTAAVGLSFADARRAARAAGGGLAVAGSNGPSSSLVSGDVVAVDRLVASLTAQGVFAKLVPGVELALHSSQMDPLVPELERELAGIANAEPAVPMVSSVLGGEVAGGGLNARYWGRNLRDPFLFVQAMERILADGCTMLLEVSPHPVLASSIQQCVRHFGARGVQVLASLRRGHNERAAMLEALGSLYEAGHRVNWSALYPSGGRTVPLPSYPWQRKRFWFDQIPGSTQGGDTGADEGWHPLLGCGVGVAGTNQRVWQKEVSARQPAWLADHRVFGDVVLPGAACLEMALAAAREIWPGAALTVADVRFESPLRLQDQPAPMQLVLERTEDGGAFTLYSGGPDWKRHAKGALRITPMVSVPTALDLDEVRRRCPRDITPAAHYAALLSGGLEYGPAFRGISRLWGGEREALGEIALPGMGAAGYGIHPALLDSALQVAAAAVTAVHRYLPEGVAGWTMYGGVPDRTYCRALVSGTPSDEELTADLDLCDERGQVFAHVAGLRLKRISAARDPLAGALWEEAWTPRPLAGTPGGPPGAWLLLGEAGGLAERVAAELRSRGQEACVAAEYCPEEWRGVVHFAEGREAWVGALHAAQSMALAPSAARLWLVTRGAQPVAGNAPDPWQATVQGLALIAGQEHPGLRCTALDLDATDVRAQAGVVASELLGADRETRVAWRGGVRYAARIIPAVAPRVAKRTPAADATYLITGGLGALGSLTARALVQAGARHLLLTGRTACDRENLVADLERMGAHVTLSACDVADQAQLDCLFNRTMAGMPPLRGLIHSAGVLDDAVLVRQSPERFRKVMRPKADGAWNLHRATKSLPLDFFILYSSAASLVGSPGQSNYAAANAFLDALAHYRRALGLPGLSINWGAWASGGMASAEPTRARMEARGVSAIPAEAGARLLRNLLYATAARIGVLPVDWRLFLEQFPEGPPSLFETLVSETPAAPAPVREQIAALPYNDREGALRGFLHDELAAVLGFDRVMRLPARQGFFDLGMDSLLSLEYLNRVSARLGLKLPATLAFDYPNLQAFGGCLMKMLAAPAEAEGPAGQLDGLSEDELARLLSRELDEGEVHVR